MATKRIEAVRALTARVLARSRELLDACEPRDDAFSRLLAVIGESHVDLASAIETLADECDAINTTANARFTE